MSKYSVREATYLKAAGTVMMESSEPKTEAKAK